MTYVRTTVDEYELMGYYGQGWELLTTETTRKGIRAREKDYRENEPGVVLRVVKRRVKINPTAQGTSA
jgi:hypothetical protein